MVRIIDAFLEIFYPKICPICQEELEDGFYACCSSCLDALPKYDENICRPMHSELTGHEIEQVCTFFKYKSVQKIIHTLKYYNMPQIGEELGAYAGKYLKAGNFFSTVDFLVPVPMFEAKEKKRGYNQAYKIALGLHKVLDIPINNSVVKKIVNTISQTKISDRAKNAQGVFEVLESAKQEYAGKHFLLVDDVFTTGSTLFSCSGEVEKIPNSRISFFTLAKANKFSYKSRETYEDC